MTNQYLSSECTGCKAILLEQEGDERTPCPLCGGLNRRKHEELFDSPIFSDEHRLKGKRVGYKRGTFDAVDKIEFYRKDAEWHRVYRLMDRENDLYVEKIWSVTSGDLLIDVSEPLSQHQGHGNAKTSANK